MKAATLPTSSGPRSPLPAGASTAGRFSRAAPPVEGGEGGGRTGPPAGGGEELVQRDSRDADGDGRGDDQPGEPLVDGGDAPLGYGAQQPAYRADPVPPEVHHQRERGGEVEADQF